MHNLKKALLGGLLLLLSLLLCACGGQENTDAAANRVVNLTSLSESMRYAQAYNMLNIAPEEYLGCTVRVKGPHSVVFDEAAQRNNHYITVSDTTVCCYVDLEFRLAEGESYPARDAEAEIEGTFRRYEAQGIAYYYLADAKVR